MKNAIQPSVATIAFILTLLLSLCFAPAVSAQVLLQENFDAADLGTPPPGWNFSGPDSNVDPGQACSGNAFRMNQFSSATINSLDTPDLPRGTTPGNVAVSFDMRLADWNNNSQLSGTGGAYAQLFVNGAFAQDFVASAPVSFTNGCLTQTATFTTADIPLGADFKIRFLGVWGSGDWSYVVDNISIRVVNDECADAVLLPQTAAPAGFLDGNVVDGSLEGATQSQPGCTGNANDDVWYKFVATERSVSLSVESGDVVVELFSGSCGNLTSLRCSDASLTNEIFDYYGTTIGETYYVRVYSFAGTPLIGTDAEFSIQIGTPRSVNDECASAEVITQSSATSCGTNLTMGTVEHATESQEACTGTANDDVWYEFIATSTDFTVYLESGDFVVQLFEGSCGNLVSLDCEDGISINETFNYASATVGATYFLRVYSFGGTALTGTDSEFGICVFTTPTVPTNDDCAAAITLAVNPSVNCASPVAGTTNGASRTEADPRCNGINGRASVWYRFTAAETEHFVTLSNVQLLNGTENARSSFEVFSGGCGALTRVHCSGQLFRTNPGPQTVSGLTVGQEYLVRVVPVNPADQIDFDICVTTDCPELATGLAATDITATTASLNIDAIAGVERDFIVVAAGDVPVFGDGSNHVFFRSSEGTIPVIATSLSSNTTYDFYVGQSCPETFAGPITFTTRPSCGDVIYDAGGPDGNYGNDEDYTVTICPETADQTGGARRVSITFDEFDLENGFDGITIYDGEDTNAPVITCPGTGLDLWSWERGRNLGSGDLQGVTVFTTNVSGCITIRFTSDGSVTLPGFKATINCPETSDIFDQILIPVPAGSGAVVADRGYLSLASEHLYYVKDGVGSLLALKLGDTQAQVPLSGVSVVAGSGATNLGLNGCMAPYTNAPDWWVMNRTWDVAPLFDPAFPVEVRFLYTTEDLTAIETASGFTGITHENLTHYKINGGDEEDLTAPGNACHDMVSPANYQEYDPGDYVYMNLSDGASRNGHAAQFMVASFSGGGGGAGTNFTGALPVEFLSFQGEAGPKFNHLNWTTAREENTAAHELERSSDGTNWEVILTLAAAGNSDEAIRYEAIDEQALAFAYYRVRTVDQDGSFTHSEIIDLQRMDTDGTRVGTAFPNPATDQVFLPYFSANEGEKLQLDLLDASGRRLSTQAVNGESGRNEFRVSLQKLPAGLYWLALTTPEGERHLRRVVKQ
ncbi:T9SS type A sorting domain-containing protein [Neolewinella agarilytica]|nr:T9SS type A sorting domain-containing protein [Neolewinella agarilytica]